MVNYYFILYLVVSYKVSSAPMLVSLLTGATNRTELLTL